MIRAKSTLCYKDQGELLIPKDHNKNCEIADPKTIRKCTCSCKGLYHGIANQKKIFEFFKE